MPADLVVVVVTYNSAHVIADLLDSVPTALEPLVAHTVVVDNGSTDDTAAIVVRRSDCTLLQSCNDGYAAGINKGVGAGGNAPAILVLNPDVRLAPGFGSRMIEALAQPSTGIVAPRIHNPDGTLNHSLRREPSILRTLGLTRTRLARFAEYVNAPSDYEQPCVVDWALGAVLLVSRECYDALGGWDESYFLYSEETDFCLRARDRGYLTRYEPRAVAIHIGGGSGRSPATHAMHIVNRVRLYRRRHGAAASLVYLVLNALREATWIRRGGAKNRAAMVALLRPSRRPSQIHCSDQLLPR